MKSRIAIAISALTLGTALAAVPSFAQTRDQPNGTAAQGGGESCVHFQQGCSDKPYPMAGQNASPNGAQSSERTGTQENRQARSASGGAGLNNQRISGSRERVSSQRLDRESTRVGVNEREGVSVGEGQRVGGESYGYGAPRYDNAAPGMRVAGANSGAVTWCETRFHSFDPATGTYVGFDGIRHACP